MTQHPGVEGRFDKGRASAAEPRLVPNRYPRSATPASSEGGGEEILLRGGRFPAGAKVLERFADAGANEGNLPFLLKVLAIGKALSIQTHPDKKMAERLHAEQPNVYKGASRRPSCVLQFSCAS